LNITLDILKILTLNNTNQPKGNQMSFMQNKRNVVSTNKNTSFEDWKKLCTAEFFKRGYEIINPSNLRMQHAWEGGDTPYGWVDFLNRQSILQARNNQVRRDNPNS